MDTKAMKLELVLILDYGSQYTHLITRRIRSLSVFSLCISGISPLKFIIDLNPRVVILSGRPHSVHTLDSPSFPARFTEWAEAKGVSVLDVCYGLQLIVQRLGRVVKVGEKQEYGRMEIEVERNSGIFGSKKVEDKQVVWISHGDEVAKLPEGFEVVTWSQQGSVAAIESPARRFYRLQCHPECSVTVAPTAAAKASKEYKVKSVKARQIIDSRSNLTVEVDLVTDDLYRSAVPSGASTEIYEALELRDGDKTVYGGKCVLTAHTINSTMFCNKPSSIKNFSNAESCSFSKFFPWSVVN